MIKILRIQLQVIIWRCILVLLFPTSITYAQEVPLPQIPTEWAIHTKNAMNAGRETLIIHLKAYDNKVIVFNARCGVISKDNSTLIAACQKESNQLDAESDLIDKEKERFLATFADNKKIYEAYAISKDFQKKEGERIDSIANSGKPIVSSGEKPGTNPFGTNNTPKNPDLNDINVDLSAVWGGSTGLPPVISTELITKIKTSMLIEIEEQKLAKKYPAFNKIVVNENELKKEDTRIKKEGVALYQQLTAKGIAATDDDWNKLKKITNDLNVNSQNLKKVIEQKKEVMNSYSVDMEDGSDKKKMKTMKPEIKHQ